MADRKSGWPYARGERERFETVWRALRTLSEDGGATCCETLGALAVFTGLHPSDLRHLLRRMTNAGVLRGWLEVPLQAHVPFRVHLARSPAEAGEGA